MTHFKPDGRKEALTWIIRKNVNSRSKTALDRVPGTAQETPELLVAVEQTLRRLRHQQRWNESGERCVAAVIGPLV